MKDCFGHTIPKSAYIVRATEVSEFLNCPLRWSVLSHNGLNLEPRASNPKLRLGTIWHKALEWHYSPAIDTKLTAPAKTGLALALAKDREDLAKEWGDAFYDEELQRMMTEDGHLMSTMLEGYLMWTDNSELCPYPESNYEFLAAEKRFLVPISTDKGNRTNAYLAVKLDAVSAKGDFLWVWEHKTRGKSMSVSNPDHLDMDLQMGLQMLALTMALQSSDEHTAIRGAVYNLARKQTPGPRVKAPIYGRHEVVRSATALDNLSRFLYRTYRDMRKASHEVHHYETLPWRYNPQPWAGLCTWNCPVRHICKAKANGDDVNYLLSVMFKPRAKDIWQTLEEEMSQDFE